MKTPFDKQNKQFNKTGIDLIPFDGPLNLNQVLFIAYLNIFSYYYLASTSEKL